MKDKKYLIDTSVILDNPHNLVALYQNGSNELYISDVVLAELNGHKEDSINEKGFFAREFIRALDAGKLEESKLKTHGEDSIFKFKFKFEGIDEEIELFSINRTTYKAASKTNDLKLVEVSEDYKLSLVTNDIALKIIALSRGVDSESLRKGAVISPEKIDFTKEFSVPKSAKVKRIKEIFSEERKHNQLIINLTSKGQETGEKEFYIVGNPDPLKMDANDFKDYQVKPTNLEQKFLLRMLAMPSAEIAVITGSTGSGKTLMALQEGLRRVKDKNDSIDGIVYLRNTVNANDKASELGFRKGDQNQKLGYFAYPLFGSINFLIYNAAIGKKSKNLEEVKSEKSNAITKEGATTKFMEDYNIEVMDIAHARGVTITNKFVIFDEAQNASNATLQLLGTRLGKNSRLVILGDYRQVDHPYLSKQRNSLVTMLKKAEITDIAAIQLRKTIRSDIAKWFQENLS